MLKSDFQSPITVFDFTIRISMTLKRTKTAVDTGQKIRLVDSRSKVSPVSRSHLMGLYLRFSDSTVLLDVSEYG